MAKDLKSMYTDIASTATLKGIKEGIKPEKLFGYKPSKINVNQLNMMLWAAKELGELTPEKLNKFVKKYRLPISGKNLHSAVHGIGQQYAKSMGRRLAKEVETSSLPSKTALAVPALGAAKLTGVSTAGAGLGGALILPTVDAVNSILLDLKTGGAYSRGINARRAGHMAAMQRYHHLPKSMQDVAATTSFAHDVLNPVNTFGEMVKSLAKGKTAPIKHFGRSAAGTRRAGIRALTKSMIPRFQKGQITRTGIPGAAQYIRQEGEEALMPFARKVIKWWNK